MYVLLDFQCLTCNNEFEELYDRDKDPLPQCSSCKGSTEILLTATRHYSPLGRDATTAVNAVIKNRPKKGK